MDTLLDWRSPQFEEELGRLDRGGVAFEFLRRNKQYRQDYADALAGVASGGGSKAETIARFSRRWGLAFPCRSCRLRPDLCPLVATAAFSCRCHCQRSASRIFCRIAS